MHRSDPDNSLIWPFFLLLLHQLQSTSHEENVRFTCLWLCMIEGGIIPLIAVWTRGSETYPSLYQSQWYSAYLKLAIGRTSRYSWFLCVIFFASRGPLLLPPMGIKSKIDIVAWNYCIPNNNFDPKFQILYWIIRFISRIFLDRLSS